MRKIQLILSALKHSYWLYKKTLLQRKHIKRHLVPSVSAILKTNDGSLTNEDIKKATVYYAGGITVFLGELFAFVRSKPLSEMERSSITYLGALTGPFDEFFDRDNLSFEKLEDFVYRTELFKPERSIEAFCIFCYKEALELSGQPDALKKAFMEVLRTQMESKKQQGEKLDIEKLKTISWGKGAAAAVFYRYCMKNEPYPEELKFYQTLGAIIQLGDDIFDFWEDSMSNTQTIATALETVNEIELVFNDWYGKGIACVEKLQLSARKQKKLIELMHLGFSRVWVCLDQFRALEKLPNPIKPNAQTRSQFICDMEKVATLKSCVQYYLKLNKSQFYS